MKRDKIGRSKNNSLVKVKEKAHLPVLAAAALAAALVLATACASTEPRLNLYGTVMDASSGQPIPGATVSDDGYGREPFRSAVTDAAGKYQYRTWPEEHNVIAQATGFEPQRRVMKTSFLGRESKIKLNFSLVRR